MIFDQHNSQNTSQQDSDINEAYQSTQEFTFKV